MNKIVAAISQGAGENSGCYNNCLSNHNTPTECRALCGRSGGSGNNVFGNIKLPDEITSKYPGGVEGGALGIFLNIILKTLIVGAGVFTLINLVLAGYAFLSAGDDEKKIQGAWTKIWQSLLGLAFAAGAFVLAAIFGQLIFGDPMFILNPSIPTP